MEKHLGPKKKNQYSSYQNHTQKQFDNRVAVKIQSNDKAKYMGKKSRKFGALSTEN